MRADDYCVSTILPLTARQITIIIQDAFAYSRFGTEGHAPRDYFIETNSYTRLSFIKQVAMFARSVVEYRTAATPNMRAYRVVKFPFNQRVCETFATISDA